METFPDGYRAAVWGASGGIGAAFTALLEKDPRCGELTALSTRAFSSGGKARGVQYDAKEVGSIREAAEVSCANGPLHLVIVAIGTLHSDGYSPEKALRQLEPEAFLEVMRVNALLPALIGQASIPHLDKEKSVFAALSARVGSISDNGLGGWHSYRASKAALNMLIKNMAIETKRRAPQSMIVGLHPGTVDTALSEPFQGNVPHGKLFSPEKSASSMLGVIDQLSADDTGLCFDYAGQQIMP
ncbi:MAG: SDR family NAD(P)-dependent oxidoreductase [Pseudomonadota bacterium]